ncbi:hypothetical protein NUW54_g12767 [Trametes sanguinea]|uniref:Uncharacterized protein n=1 Tax=Trametes sanguinea TaxID=158606 RepID=A0ACC1MUC1_9APHY|nr:hypothetical protein NUW54_g12767 [Trametes sanguinea]
MGSFRRRAARHPHALSDARKAALRRCQAARKKCRPLQSSTADKENIHITTGSGSSADALATRSDAAHCASQTKLGCGKHNLRAMGAKLNEARADRDALQSQVSKQDRTIENLQGRLRSYQRQHHNENRQLKRAQSMNNVLRQKLMFSEHERRRLLKAAAAASGTYARTMRDSQIVIGRLEELATHLRSKLGVSQQQSRTLLRHCARFPKLLASAKKRGQHARGSGTKSVVQLREKGVYTPQARSLARALVRAGCAQDRVGMVIQLVAGALGVAVKAKMSTHTVRRAVIEGGIASDIQVGFELAHAKRG